MKNFTCLAIGILMLFGCDAFEDMKGVFEKGTLISESIKKEHGWDTQVGWNMDNGTLTQVTVHFSAEQIRQETVAAIEKATLKAVHTNFDSKAEVVYIQIASTEKN